MCLFIQSQEEKDVATVELKKIIYITLKGVGMGMGVTLNSQWHNLYKLQYISLEEVKIVSFQQ